MSRVDELISGFAGIMKGTVEELERSPHKRYFEIRASFLWNREAIIMSAMELKCGVIVFEFFYRVGQVISSECCLELLKMSFFGVKGLYTIAVQDSDDPPAYFIYLKYDFYVSAQTPVQEAINIFQADFLSLIVPAKWPNGAYIGKRKTSETSLDLRRKY